MNIKLMLSNFLLVIFLINIASIPYQKLSFINSKNKTFQINLETIFENIRPNSQTIPKELSQTISQSILSIVEQISLQDNADLSKIKENFENIANIFNKYISKDSDKIKINITETKIKTEIQITLFGETHKTALASHNRFRKIIFVVDRFVYLFRKILLNNITKIFELDDISLQKNILYNLNNLENIDEQKLQQIGFSKLHFAIYTEDITNASKLIKEGYDINQTITNKNTFGLAGFTPMHLAVFMNQKYMVKLLIKNNCDIIAMTSTGDTPIMLAKKMGYFDLIPILLKYEDSKRYNHSIYEKELFILSKTLDLMRANKFDEAKQLLQENNTEQTEHPIDLLDPLTRKIIQKPVFARSGFNYDYVMQEILDQYNQHRCKITTSIPIFDQLIELLDKKHYKSAKNLLIKHLETYFDKLITNPYYLTCPITKLLIVKAVTISDTRSYDLDALSEHYDNWYNEIIHTNNCNREFLSPVTNTPVSCNYFITNYFLTSMIDFYRTKTIFQCIKYARILISINATLYSEKINQLIKRIQELKLINPKENITSVNPSEDTFNIKINSEITKLNSERTEKEYEEKITRETTCPVIIFFVVSRVYIYSLFTHLNSANSTINLIQLNNFINYSV
jgi:ankyrin repeat protein